MVMDFTQAVTWAITLLGIFSSLVFGLVKLLLSQMEKRLGERFASQEKEIAKLAELERDFLRFQAELPLHYVHRQDYVRNQTVIEAKLDGLRDKLEVVQMKGAKQ
ncbi:hypothetical protein [Ectopseudomonas toyotomiensis]|uniref:Uncharacterized protein n=1 Tax=Ectopseudomonas toyotomiensis TaxID=554344 RepID=A0A1I5YMV5_9GAMM|nr:hypothetical protein [Pseudomonas toyotomiensis]SFQ25252.1 hypothetical protein SAMN05216177_109269 [Pseudomonas toyotomiensis]SFQ45569.1 hypothetical protein SAMN05216177_1157 [Pseudomonas toyotomiensis]